MVQHVMPTVPWIIFAFLEPLSLVYGAYTIVADPDAYLRALGPTPESYNTDSASVGSILSLANTFLLIAAAQFLCCHVSREPRIPQAYIFFIILADYGHLWALYKGLGYNAFMDYQNWDSVVGGNIGATAVLNVLRIAYLFGAFGKNDYTLSGTADPSKKLK